MDALAIATVSLASVAVWSILQTRSIHKKELKIKLLDEIAEWALSIQTSCLEINIPVTGKPEPKLFKTATEYNIMFKYTRLLTKSPYIESIALVVFKKDLLSDVKLPQGFSLPYCSSRGLLLV